MAKLGAMIVFALERSNNVLAASRTSGGMPVVPTTAWTPLAAYHSRRSPIEAAVVKSTATSAPELRSESTPPLTARSGAGPSRSSARS